VERKRILRLVLGVAMVLFGSWMLLSSSSQILADSPVGEGMNSTDLMAISGNETVEANFYSSREKITSLELEVANSDEEREKGLMFRKNLSEGTGMVFVWNDSKERGFWMKNTYIPLDMIFVAENGTVLNVEEADPEPDTLPPDLETYTSDGPALYVIETNKGFSESKGIEKGTQVVFSH
jgi:uncharacterized membrane protein (UPF0127 family)